MEKKYIACLLLHALGDTIGFKNGEWEFKPGSFEKTLEKVYEFIDLGGITLIDLNNWIVSDDTIMHIKTAEALIKDYNNVDTFETILKEKYIEAYHQFIKEGIQKRFPGNATMKYLKRLDEGGKWDNTPYDKNAGGSGASMRSLCIGLAFYGQDNRHKLIQIAIESSRITHNSTVGYLGGLASALFTALAIENTRINDWPFILIELFNDGTILKYIKSAGRDESHYLRDHHVFVEKWMRYIEDKFDENREVINRKSTKNLVYRGKYYAETFGFKYEQKRSNLTEYKNVFTFIGSGGDDSVIIAYDCLIDSGANWEKLVYYAMLHIGDTDTTGCIAGGLYGALYGFKNVSEHLLDHLEYKDELIGISKKLFEKYYKN